MRGGGGGGGGEFDAGIPRLNGRNTVKKEATLRVMSCKIIQDISHVPNRMSLVLSNSAVWAALLTGEKLFGELLVFGLIALDAEIDAVVGVPQPQHTSVVSEDFARLRGHS